MGNWKLGIGKWKLGIKNCIRWSWNSRCWNMVSRLWNTGVYRWVLGQRSCKRCSIQEINKLWHDQGQRVFTVFICPDTIDASPLECRSRVVRKGRISSRAHPNQETLRILRIQMEDALVWGAGSPALFDMYPALFLLRCPNVHCMPPNTQFVI